MKLTSMKSVARPAFATCRIEYFQGAAEFFEKDIPVLLNQNFNNYHGLASRA